MFGGLYVVGRAESRVKKLKFQIGPDSCTKDLKQKYKKQSSPHRWSSRSRRASGMAAALGGSAGRRLRLAGGSG